MKYIALVTVVIAVVARYLSKRGSSGPTQKSADAAPGHPHQQLPRDGGVGGG